MPLSPQQLLAIAFHSLYAVVRASSKDANVDADDGDDDAEEGDSSKLADESHANEDDDGEQDQYHGAIQAETVGDVPEHVHLWRHVHLPHTETVKL